MTWITGQKIVLSNKENKKVQTLAKKLTTNKAFILATEDYGFVSLWKDHFTKK